MNDLLKPAVFSKDRKHRFTLRRELPGLGRCSFICLNPSTADETVDDPTVRRCVDFATRWGYGEFFMLNLFSLRSTDPRQLKREEPNCGANDLYIKKVCRDSDLVVVAWGTHGSYLHRDEKVIDMLELIGVHPVALAVTKDGSPGHPLYLRASLAPISYHRLIAGLAERPSAALEGRFPSTGRQNGLPSRENG